MKSATHPHRCHLCCLIRPCLRTALACTNCALPHHSVGCVAPVWVGQHTPPSSLLVHWIWWHHLIPIITAPPNLRLSRCPISLGDWTQLCECAGSLNMAPFRDLNSDLTCTQHYDTVAVPDGIKSDYYIYCWCDYIWWAYHTVSLYAKPPGI